MRLVSDQSDLRPQSGPGEAFSTGPSVPSMAVTGTWDRDIYSRQLDTPFLLGKLLIQIPKREEFRGRKGKKGKKDEGKREEKSE